MKVSACTLALLLLVASFLPLLSATAAETNSVARASESATNDSVDVLMLFVRTLGALVLVVTLLIAGAWFFKRSRMFSLYQAGPSQLKVLESRSIGYRNNLVVVAYSQQRFLIAVSATGVSLLSTLPDAVVSEERTSSNAPTFAAQLATFEERKA